MRTKLTSLQAGATVTSTIIGIGILSFPRYMAEAGDNGAPLVALAGTVIAFVSLHIVTSLCRKFPHENLFVFSRRLIGRAAADVMNALVFLFFTLLTALTLRQFGEVSVMVLFQKTPIEAVMLLMLLVTMLSTRRNVVKFSYIHYFYLPFIIAPVLGIVLIALGDIDVQNLLPVAGGTLFSFTKGALNASGLLQSSFIVVLIIPFMKNPGKAPLIGGISVGIIGLLYVLLTVASIGIFGPEETKLLFYPTLETARSAQIGFGIERLDALFLIIWVISVFTTTYTTYYLSSYCLRELTGFRDQRFTSSLLLPYVYILALIPGNVFQTYDIAYYLGIAGLGLLTGYPLLLSFVYAVRAKGGGQP